jgi:hypothetical protein
MVNALRAVIVLVHIFLCASTYAADAVFQSHDNRDDTPKVRQWVWTHWSRHTSGTAILKWLTVEGETGTTIYKVGKDSGGAWYLSFHLESTDSHTEGEATSQRGRRSIAYSVQRVERPYHRNWPGKPIQHSRPLPATRYVLELTDKDGKMTHI